MAINGIRALASSMDEDGQNWSAFIHKTGGPSSLGFNGRWADMSMGAGIPKYNAYVGTQTTATVLTGAGNDGIYCGPAITAGQTKHVTGFCLYSAQGTVIPSYWTLADYLMFYPLIDGDSTDQQDMDNTASLTRYTDGNGVQCMAVCTTPMASNATCTVSYTNNAGTAGRSSSFSVISSTAVGCIVSSSNTSAANGSVSPFIPLASGDTGIRSIESVTMATPSGGFFSLVLVKPLANMQLRETSTATETSQVMQRGGVLPEVKTGAFLNLFYNSGSGGFAAPLQGRVDFAWR
jgi:hypothetical protein